MGATSRRPHPCGTATTTRCQTTPNVRKPFHHRDGGPSSRTSARLAPMSSRRSAPEGAPAHRPRSSALLAACRRRSPHLQHVPTAPRGAATQRCAADPPGPSLVAMLLAEDLLLLLTDDATGKLLLPAEQVDIALGGANLLELTLLERVSLDEGKHVVVFDPSSTRGPDPGRSTPSHRCPSGEEAEGRGGTSRGEPADRVVCPAGCRGCPARPGEEGARYPPRSPLAGRESRARAAHARAAYAGAGSRDHAGRQDCGAHLVAACPEVRAQDRQPEGARTDPQGAPGEGGGALAGRLGVRGGARGDRGRDGRSDFR